MKLTDRMIQGTKNLEKEKKQIKERNDIEEDEMGYAYMPAPKMRFINKDKGAFDNEDDTSINTMKSVFDRTAIFHTNTEE